jgi:uncharacterized membrane protein
MEGNTTEGRTIRLAGAGHAGFAAMMITLGILGFIKRDFTVVWAPVPKGVPAREVLVYFCALVSLASGIGMLFRRTAAASACALLTSLILWFLLWRVRPLVLTPGVESTWSCGQTFVMIAAAWVLFTWFARGGGWQQLRFATGDKAVRIARVLYGLGLIPFGVAHFVYLKQTVVLVPGYLPWPVGWAYFTGATFIVAGFAVIAGVFARLAAALSALQMGLFTLLIWIPLIPTGTLTSFQWGEFVASLALTAAGWVIADSYRGTPRLALRSR